MEMKSRILTERLIEDQQIKQKHRTYLGASLIGKECPRAIWYEFRHYKTISITPRLHRLFQRGHREEPIIIHDLKKIGVRILATQEGAKFCYGHGGAHHDGRIKNVPDAPKTEHLLECKTINEKGFRELKAHKVKAARPRYWIQLHVYMGLFNLKRALFIAVNKNTDERYYERVKFDKEVYNDALRKAESIIFAPFPPKKISRDSSFYLCGWCDYKGICHNGEVPEKNCRSCSFSEPLKKKGKWKCQRRDKKIKKKACKDWQII